MYLSKFIKNFCITLFFVICLILLFFSYNKFPGQKIYLLILFLISNYYIFFSFKYSQLFLDKTLSIFLWLGFYYKLTILLITESGLPEGRGNFDYLPYQYNELIIFSSIGILSFIISSYCFHKFFKKFFNHSHRKSEKDILVNFYGRYKNYIYLIFLCLILFVSIINLKLGFYQKGLLPKTEVNLIFGYFIKWMLLFGLTSISCLLIDYNIKKYNKLNIFIITLFFLELLMTNLSLLSRSLIFTGSAVLVATYLNYEKEIKFKGFDNSLIVNFLILFLIFSISIFPINKIRNSNFINQEFIAEQILKNYEENNKNKQINEENNSLKINSEKDKKSIDDIINSKINNEEKLKLIEQNLQAKELQNLDFYENINRILFVIKNRFVGLDGVATVVSYPNKSTNLFIDALHENYDSNEYSFYQKTFIIPFEQKHLVGKEYTKSSERHYGVILPGIISFLSYSGSKLFLFISGFVILLFCAFIETIARVLSYNSIIFSNLVGYVLGYRLIHFGYVPKQSYLIIGAIILTIFLVKFLKLIIIKYYKNYD